MINYKLVDVIKRKSKEGKEYNIAVILYKDDNGYSLLETMVKDKQVDALLLTLKNPSFDLSKYAQIVYNRFSKAYQLQITYAL